MKCLQCGTENNNNMFCTECGNKIAVSTPSPTKKQYLELVIFYYQFLYIFQY